MNLLKQQILLVVAVVIIFFAVSFIVSQLNSTSNGARMYKPFSKSQDSLKIKHTLSGEEAEAINSRYTERQTGHRFRSSNPKKPEL